MEMTTPTPGDMSARHLAQLRDLRAFSANESYKPSLDWAIAALSALPAGGGTRMFNCRRCPVSVESRWIEPECPECGDPCELDATAKATTPQPSAAEGYNDGSDRVRDWRQPAAVGAQGDGFRAALEQIAAETSANNATEAADRFQRIARDALAAPAAGKGVDADKFMAAFNCEAENTTGTRIYCADRQNVVTALEAALTRQPVAGDGMVLVPREPTPEMIAAGDNVDGETDWHWNGEEEFGVEGKADPKKVYAAMLAAAPTDTPTDGGGGNRELDRKNVGPRAGVPARP